MFLERKGPEPVAFWLSRMCEDFGALPDAVLLAQRRLPIGLLDDVIEARRYAEYKALYDRDPEHAPQTGLGRLVMEIDFALAEAEIKGNG